MKYDKTQIGWFLIAVFLLIIFSVSIAYFKQVGARPLTENAYYTLLFLFIALLLLLYKLRIKVDDKGIRIIYGIGLIRFTINPEKINYVKETKTSLLYGWGIRFIPGGMLYNIQGTKSVELSYFKNETKSKIVRIGSADCQNLMKAIKERYNASTLTV